MPSPLRRFAALLIVLVAPAARAQVSPDPPPPPAPRLVPVAFIPRYAQTAHRILIAGRSCVAPCVLELPPGPAQLLVQADRLGTLEQPLAIPDAPATVRIDIRATGALRAIGIVAGTLGLAVGVGGTVLFTAGEFRGHEVIGGGLMGAGALMLGIGALGLVYSATPSRATLTPGNPYAAPTARLRLESIGLIPIAGGAAIGARMTF